METKPIHYLKGRKSDFLAGIDLEIFELEGKSTFLTIKSVEYKENFLVNGRRKPKGIVISFEESYAKPFILNTTNADFVKKNTGVIDASKWIGFTLGFFLKTDVEMKISKTETIKGGLRINKVNTNGFAPELADINTRIDQSSNKAELMNLWQGLSETEQIEYKDKMNAKYKTL